MTVVRTVAFGSLILAAGIAAADFAFASTEIINSSRFAAANPPDLNQIQFANEADSARR